MPPKKISESKNTSAIATTEEELLLISEQNEVNLVGNEWTLSFETLNPKP